MRFHSFTFSTALRSLPISTPQTPSSPTRRAPNRRHRGLCGCVGAAHSAIWMQILRRHRWRAARQQVAADCPRSAPKMAASAHAHSPTPVIWIQFASCLPPLSFFTKKQLSELAAAFHYSQASAPGMQAISSGVSASVSLFSSASFMWTTSTASFSGTVSTS